MPTHNRQSRQEEKYALVIRYQGCARENKKKKKEERDRYRGRNFDVIPDTMHVLEERLSFRRLEFTVVTRSMSIWSWIHYGANGVSSVEWTTHPRRDRQ